MFSFFKYILFINKHTKQQYQYNNNSNNKLGIATQNPNKSFLGDCDRDILPNKVL